jgi:uncharacterized protein (DUF1501 family)
MKHTRRDFLKAALGTSALMPFAINTAIAGKGGEKRDTVLVVVQLSGGNDGLNTVIPYGDDEYARNRPTIRRPEKELHKIDSYIGFHPRMGAFSRLYKEGNLSIIQGVGSPYADRSHENAMRTWQTADTENLHRQTGWLGRALDNEWNPDQVSTPAVFVGPIARPFALNARKVIVPSINSPADLTADKPPANPHVQARNTNKSLLDFVRRCSEKAAANNRKIEAAMKRAAQYPAFGLARHLQTAAQLIRADIGLRIIFLELGGGGIGGLDNHANQIGNHCAMMHQLSESIAAFVDDLKTDNTLDRVLLMTFSEFGRTLKENGRRGTNHGNAAPVFLAGTKLKNPLIGTHPSLKDLDNGALKHNIDFRKIYATVLKKWLRYNPHPTLTKKHKPLDILTT